MRNALVPRSAPGRAAAHIGAVPVGPLEQVLQVVLCAPPPWRTREAPHDLGPPLHLKFLVHRLVKLDQLVLLPRGERALVYIWIHLCPERLVG